MPSPTPYVRTAGAGAAVVCLHSNAASSSQWRALMELLAPTHQVLAVDSWGAGRSPEWPSDRVITLADEVALLEPVLQGLNHPVTLVGHSYGGAIALKAALASPERVRSLVVYEPTLFAAVDAGTASAEATSGIRNAVGRAAAALDAGDADGAARAFIDYWMGEGAWAATPEPRRGPIAASMVNVRRWAHALTTETTPLSAFAGLQIPVLYMVGGRSPRAAQAVAEVLVPVLPRVEQVAFDALGHMGPITHAEVVNAEIARFLRAG